MITSYHDNRPSVTIENLSEDEVVEQVKRNLNDPDVKSTTVISMNRPERRKAAAVDRRKAKVQRRQGGAQS